MKFTHSKWFRNMLGKAYGIGASIVIVGALAKILHWPFANEALILGMLTEAVVFFLSAFEPLYIEPKWEKVYPELSDEQGGRVERRPAVMGSGVSVQLDKVLQEANIGPELVESLGKGMQNLSENAAKMADLSNAVVATNDYVKNVESASKSVMELGISYHNATEYLKHDLSLSQEYGESLKNAVSTINQLSKTYQDVANSARENLDASQSLNQNISTAGEYAKQLGQSYSKNVEILSQAVDSISTSSEFGNRYSEQLQNTANSLMALNSAYELQLKAAGDQEATSQKLRQSAEDFANNLDVSLSETKQYREEIEKLNANIKALNNVYGNMLSAMGGNK